MNSNQLSKRLEIVSSFIHPARTMADIGSDHAYLPCFAVKRNLVETAIAGEVVEGPFQSAKQQVEAEGLTSQIDVRKGNGLAVLQPGEVECITIAGMGGPLITSILEEGKEKLAGVQKMVLQPNIAAHTIREWLEQNNWTIEAEEILEEDGQIYEVIVAVPGGGLSLTDQEKLFGPFLMKNQNQAFKEKWQRELNKIDQVLLQLSLAKKNEETKSKTQMWLQKKQWIKEVLENENPEWS